MGVRDGVGGGGKGEEGGRGGGVEAGAGQPLCLLLILPAGAVLLARRLLAAHVLAVHVLVRPAPPSHLRQSAHGQAAPRVTCRWLCS